VAVAAVAIVTVTWDLPFDFFDDLFIISGMGSDNAGAATVTGRGTEGAIAAALAAAATAALSVLGIAGAGAREIGAGTCAAWCAAGRVALLGRGTIEVGFRVLCGGIPWLSCGRLTAAREECSCFIWFCWDTEMLLGTGGGAGAM